MQIDSNADTRSSAAPVVTRPAPTVSLPARPIAVTVPAGDEKLAGPTIRYVMVGLLVIGVVTATAFAIARQQVDAPTAAAPTAVPGEPVKADPVQLNKLMEAVRANPNDFDSLVNLGDYYYQTGDYTNAASAYSHAVTQQPTDMDAQESLGNAYLHSGDYARAADTLTAVYKADPTRAAVAVALCVALIQQGGSKRTEGLTLWTKVRNLSGLSDSDKQNLQTYMDHLISQATPVAAP